MSDDTRLHGELAAVGIRFEQVEHAPVFTVLESSALYRGIPGAHTKNLFLKDTDGQFYLVTVLAEKQVDLGALRHLVGAKRFSFGSADEMIALLG
ncbi:YbaK/EbsC family protein, partial [Blastomonas sp.]|uniref:YbaK/EbsC family protein n=1 Tax=Blastomonas sp. TaxID=1909299 RepID=UPI0035946205